MRYGSIKAAGLAFIESDQDTKDLVLGNEVNTATATRGADVVSNTPDVLTTEAEVSTGHFVRLTVGEVPFDVTLPEPSMAAGRHIYFAIQGETGEFALKSYSGLINGVDATTGISVVAEAYEQFHAICDGTDWWVGRFSAALSPPV